MKRSLVVFLFLVVSLSLISAVFIENETFTGSSTPNDWYIDGNIGEGHNTALTIGNKEDTDFFGAGAFLRLTENSSWNRAWAYYKGHQISMLGVWSIELDIRIGKDHSGSETTNGADGLTIVFLDATYAENAQGEFDPTKAEGGYGEWQGAPQGKSSGYLGYHADLKGYSFEWDHYKNGEELALEYNHWVDIEKWAHSGWGENMGNDTGYYYNDGWRHCKLSSNGAGIITFEYSNDNDNDLEKSFTINPGSRPITGGDPNYQLLTNDYLAYVGFTAATGGAAAFHEIKNVVIRGNDSPLPVTLSSFTAAYINSQSTLSWTTQSESQNSGWNILRNTTADFNSSVQLNSAIIEGYGTTSEPSDYSFVDEDDLESGQTYWYWLESISYSGASEYFGPIAVEVINQDDFEEAPAVESAKGLLPNYPNPFNPETSIMFSLAENEVAEYIEIYNMRGQKVDAIQHPANPQSWDGKDSAGNQLASGIYTYILKTNLGQYKRKMVLTK